MFIHGPNIAGANPTRGYAWFKWDGLKVVEAYNAFDPTEYNKAFSD